MMRCLCRESDISSPTTLVRAHLESHAHPTRGDTARRTPAPIGQSRHHNSTAHFPTPEEPRFNHTEYRQSFSILQYRLWDSIQRGIGVFGVGEEGLENGRGTLAFFWQGEAGLGELGLLGELARGLLGKGGGLEGWGGGGWESVVVSSCSVSVCQRSMTSMYAIKRAYNLRLCNHDISSLLSSLSFRQQVSSPECLPCWRRT